MGKKKRIEEALDFAFRYGQIEGDHHKAWVLDQMVRALTGDEYETWVKEYVIDGMYDWEEGIAP